MNQDEISFKSQFILESLAKKDPGFTFNLTHDSDKKVTGIVSMTSYMRDSFERFGDYISIDVMHSFICNAKSFCYIAPVIKTKMGKLMLFVKDLLFRKFMILISLFWNHCSRCDHLGGERCPCCFF